MPGCHGREDNHEIHLAVLDLLNLSPLVNELNPQRKLDKEW